MSMSIEFGWERFKINKKYFLLTEINENIDLPKKIINNICLVTHDLEWIENPHITINNGSSWFNFFTGNDDRADARRKFPICSNKISDNADDHYFCIINNNCCAYDFYIKQIYLRSSSKFTNEDNY